MFHPWRVSAFPRWVRQPTRVYIPHSTMRMPIPRVPHGAIPLYPLHIKSSRNGGVFQRRTGGRTAGSVFDIFRKKKDLNDPAFMEVDSAGYGKIDYIPFGAICGKKNYTPDRAQAGAKPGVLGDPCDCVRTSGHKSGVSSDNGWLIPPPSGYSGKDASEQICKYNGINGVGDSYGRGEPARDIVGAIPPWARENVSNQSSHFKQWQAEYWNKPHPGR